MTAGPETAPAPTRTSAPDRGPAPVSLDNDEIQRLLPHRWPMLLLDSVHDVVPGVSGRGRKAVTATEPCFAGHFPGHAVMPGVLIVEALAQLAGVVLAAQALQTDGAGPAPGGPPIGYLGSLRQIKFTRLVVPGEVLELRAEIGKSVQGLVNVQVSASVDREQAVVGALTVTLPKARG